MPMPVTELTITADSDLESLSQIRHLLECVSEAFACAVDADVLQLLITELGANAMQADSSRVTVGITRLVGPALRIEVHDDGDGWPQLRRPEPLELDGGRGLLIVDALADRWGASSGEDQGVTVWFELSPAC